MQLKLNNTKAEVLTALRQNEEQQLSKIRTQIQKHQEEKDAASRDIQELNVLKHQKDMLLFTKVPTSISLLEILSSWASLSPHYANSMFKISFTGF